MKTETASPICRFALARTSDSEIVAIFKTREEAVADLKWRAVPAMYRLVELREVNAYDALVEALAFYMAICGNTAYSTTRESAMEAYEMGKKALALAKEGK